MNAKEMSALHEKCDSAMRNLNTAIRMLPSKNYSISLNYIQAVRLTELLCQVAEYFDWKLENTEVRNDVGNKRRPKRKRK